MINKIGNSHKKQIVIGDCFCCLIGAKSRMCVVFNISGGLGGTFRITTEFLIFATKGSLKAIETVVGTWFEVKRKYVKGYPCHSKKPDFFYELIEKVSPGKRLEMFAREQRKGWDVFGNEVANSIAIPVCNTSNY